MQNIQGPGPGPGPVQRASHLVRMTASLAREQRALSRAFRAMPKPVPWDWAAPRVMPLLSGPRFDSPGEPLVRITSQLGPAVHFGLDLGQFFAVVDEPVAQRWECSADQLLERGLGNLRERAARIERSQVINAVMSGRSIRILRDRPIWASSLLLDLDSLTRLFGPHDQILAAPTTRCLVSLPLDTPERAAAEIVIELEESAMTSLFLDPFVLEDGVLSWIGNLAFDDD